MTRVYVKALGLVHGSEALSLVGQGLAGRLAGGQSAFTMVEVMARGAASRFLTYAQARASVELKHQMDVIEAARPDFAGLAMDRTHVMGIVNVTPDSFSDGGQAQESQAAIAQGRRLAAEGAVLLDVGGESTRPGSDAVPEQEELTRVLPVIEALAQEGFRLSVDTRKPGVMAQAAAAGAQVLNDVSALSFAPYSAQVVAGLGLPIVLMHAQGDPKTMQQKPHYENVVLDVYDALEDFVARAVAAGIARAHIMVDPGIGFGKSFRHNLEILENLALYHGLGVPVLLGASRKAFIGAITGETLAGKRMAGSVGVALHGAACGVQVIRVHDVRESVQALATFQAVRYAAGAGI